MPAKDILGFGANLLLTIQLKNSFCCYLEEILLMEKWPHHGGQIRPFLTSGVSVGSRVEEELKRGNDFSFTLAHITFHSLISRQS